MKLIFVGTRGEIEARTPKHRMHSSLLVSYRGTKVMIDCGLDWLGRFARLRPKAIVLTRLSGSRLGFEKRRAVPGVRATKELENAAPLQDRQSPTD
jgi:hypothetical protein